MNLVATGSMFSHQLKAHKNTTLSCMALNSCWPYIPVKASTIILYGKSFIKLHQWNISLCSHPAFCHRLPLTLLYYKQQKTGLGAWRRGEREDMIWSNRRWKVVLKDSPIGPANLTGVKGLNLVRKEATTATQIGTFLLESGLFWRTATPQGSSIIRWRTREG